jgi:hypothetical protein
MNMKNLVSVSIAVCASAGIVLAAESDASAQGVVVDIVPPAGFVATTEPVYYEGHPAYWYHNRWYYRNPHGWGWYHDEPAYLRDRRVREPPRRWHYEHRR